MALDPAPGAAAAPTPPTPPATPPGPALSTRDATAQPVVELGVMYGQAASGREPVMEALTNLQQIGQQHGCDAIIAVRLMHYPTATGTTVVAYGTGVRYLPEAEPEPSSEPSSEPATLE